MAEHSHDHPHHHQGGGDIRVAFLLNISFTLIEIVGGLWTNSLAILSDALHDLGDSVSLGLAWYLERYSQRSEDARYSYGYRRFSLLAALINTLILLLGSLFILSEAVPRLLNPEHTNAGGMALLAVMGIAVNGIAVLRVRRSNSMNARVVAWHLLEDVLGWVAVLVVSLVLLVADIHILDPILSVLITLYILVNVVRNLKKTMALFLQSVPDEVDLQAIKGAVEALPGVATSHHLHAWSLEGESHVLSLHVVVDEMAERKAVIAIRRRIRELLHNADLAHTTIEIEYGPDDCMIRPGPTDIHAH